MRTSHIAVFLILVCLPTAALCAPVGTSFTYQGQLHDNGQPAEGAYDFELSIYDDPGAAVPLETQTVCGVELLEGIFTLEVDFGAVFDGEKRWIEVGIATAGSCNGSTIFVYLDPRQEITAAPHAILAQEAFNADRLDGLDAGDFLRTTGTANAEDLTLSGRLTLDAGATLVFPDGTVQTTAAMSGGPSVTRPEVFTPAFLTCGDNAQSDPAQWAPIAIATFQLRLDEATYDVTANFAGIDPAAGMMSVAERVQTAIRSATGGQQTVDWDGRFIIRSDLATVQSAISPLASTGSPVDISGAGADPWLDCETGRGVVKEAVLDLSVYNGHAVLLNDEGQLDPIFRGPGGKIGVASFAPTSLSDTKTIVHNLGRIPKRIRIRWFSTNALYDSGRNEGEGIFDGSTYATIAEIKSGNPRQMTTTSTNAIIISDQESSGFNWTGAIGENAENHFRIDVVSYNRSGGPINMIWEVE